MTKNDKKYSNIKITKLENSEIEIEGEISADLLEEKRGFAIKKLMENSELPGFRKGFAPENLVIQKFGDMRILEDAAQEALHSQYTNIITDNSIKVIGDPHIHITKLAQGNPLGFKIKTAVFPEVKIPNYKSIAKEEMSKATEVTSVDEKEIEAIIEQIRKSKAKEGGEEDAELPAFDDAFAQSLGDFKTADELKEKIKENALFEKKMQEKEKNRLTILERLVKESEISVPEIMVESEFIKMLAQFKDDIAKAGLTYEAYLSHIKKTEDDIKKEWRENAIKRAKTQLILAKISEEEKITPEEDRVQKEVDHIISHHKEADRFRVRMYVENMLTNEKTLEFLENQK
jgi:FKBP-type peptidyl-prolyl cis-trans isomerase (trigger factor)